MKNFQFAVLTVFLFAINGISQQIDQNALHAEITPLGSMVSAADSIVGNQTFILKHNNGNWCYETPLRKIGNEFPETRRNHSGNYSLIESYCPAVFTEGKHLDSLKKLYNNERVVMFGLHEVFVNRKSEFFAIRLTSPISFDTTLHIFFEYYGISGKGQLSLKTNFEPTLKNAITIDTIDIDSTSLNIQTSYSQSFKGLQKNIGHTWLIFDLKVLNSENRGNRYERCFFYLLPRKVPESVPSTLDY
jgi:hypothetical protein